MASQKFDITIGAKTQTVYNKDAVDKLLTAAGSVIIEIGPDQIFTKGDTSTTLYAYLAEDPPSGAITTKFTGTYNSTYARTQYSISPTVARVYTVGVMLSSQADADTAAVDRSKIVASWSREGYILAAPGDTQNLNNNLRVNGELLHKDGTADYALLGYHDYGASGWKAIEVGNEEHHLTLNSFDDGTTTVPQNTNMPLLGRPLVNWKDTATPTPNEKQDAVALVNLDVVPLIARIDNLELMGSWIGSFATYAAVPTTVSAFQTATGITPTKNDEITVQADETKSGQADVYRVGSIDSNGNITWAYDHDLGSDTSGKVDKVTTSGTVTRKVDNSATALGMSYTDTGNTGNNAALAIVAGTVNLSVGSSGISVVAGTTPGTTNDVTLKRQLAYASLIDASVMSLGDVKQYASISNETAV